MNKILIILSVLTISVPTFSGQQALQPIIRSDRLFKHILKNQPNLDSNYVLRLSNAILDASIKYKVNPYKLSAILRQESGYKLNIINKATKDYSIGQINERTIKAFNMDKQRLLTDLTYSVNMSAFVLADFQRMYGHKEQDFWTRYNSSNPIKRNTYKMMVARFL